ncbi:MAG: hypothetical protein NVSMB52_09680 [Chloroflexota bacterium]
MKFLLLAEWLKLRKRWMPRALAIIMLVSIALLFWGLGTSARARPNLFVPRAWLSSMYIAGLFAPFIWPILGGSWAGNEYGWGTVRMVLSRRPDRMQFVLAGLAVLILATGAALVAAMVFGTVAGIVVAVITGTSAVTSSAFTGSFMLLLLKCFFATWFVLTFYVVLAYTAGTVFRSAAVGIGAGIGITVAQIIAAGIFSGLGGVWKDVAQHFPIQYANALTSRLTAEGTVQDFANVGSTAPGVVECLLGFTVYIAVLVGAMLFLVRSRDVTS